MLQPELQDCQNSAFPSRKRAKVVQNDATTRQFLVCRIYDLLTELKIHAHYLSCNGVRDSTQKR
jgi:hypothetical protein